jgi:hypothetical protein
MHLDQDGRPKASNEEWRLGRRLFNALSTLP